MVGDAIGHADRNSEIPDCDVFVSRRFIVLADCAYSFSERTPAKAIDRLDSFDGVDCNLRVARMGLHAGCDLDLGTGWKMGVGSAVSL